MPAQAVGSGSLPSWWLAELPNGSLNVVSRHLDRLDVQASLGDQVITDHQDSDAHNTQSLSRIGPWSFLFVTREPRPSILVGERLAGGHLLRHCSWDAGRHPPAGPNRGVQRASRQQSTFPCLPRP